MLGKRKKEDIFLQNLNLTHENDSINAFQDGVQLGNTNLSNFFKEFNQSNAILTPSKRRKYMDEKTENSKSIDDSIMDIDEFNEDLNASKDASINSIVDKYFQNYFQNSSNGYIPLDALSLLFQSTSCFLPWNGLIIQPSFDLISYAIKKQAQCICLIGYGSDFSSTLNIHSLLESLNEFAPYFEERGIQLATLSVDNPYAHRALIQYHQEISPHKGKSLTYSGDATMNTNNQFINIPMLSDLRHTMLYSLEDYLKAKGCFFDLQLGTSKYVCIKITFKSKDDELMSFAKVQWFEYDITSNNPKTITNNISHAIFQL